MIKLAAIVSILSIAACIRAKAAIVLSGDFTNGSSIPTLEITADIPLRITASGSALYLIFRQWTLSDGNQTATAGPAPQDLVFAYNGGDNAVDLTFFLDNLATDAANFMEDDGLIAFENGILVASGDFLLIKAGAYIFEPDAEFNPLLTGRNFSGEVFLADGNGSPLSDIVVVPEPSALFLCTMASLVFLRRRR